MYKTSCIRLTLLAVSPLLAMACWITDVSAANITYNLVSRTLVPTRPSSGVAEYSVTGTITTNGDLGTLMANDIVAYDILVAGPVPQLFASGTNDFEVTVFGELNATEKDLFLTWSGDDGPEGHSSLTFHSLSPQACCRPPNVRWYIGPEILGPWALEDYRTAGAPGTTAWFTEDVNAGDTFVIAVVPEPSALSLVVMAAAVTFCRKFMKPLDSMVGDDH